ncbi:hypothetical protein OIO90_000430 [Microbotryomycetes sp. JL221]|nr:hypothetical protein OIO90_000430 [Microbotryomycetes sp. JL221]
MDDDVAIKRPTIELAPIWWSNMIFFVGMHVLALIGVVYWSPVTSLDRRTMWCAVDFPYTRSDVILKGTITIGYHRLWSHRAFKARLPLRIILAAMGCLGFQGSIKWWTMRHRLHHRFTDTDSDPYDAKKGLYHSHMGWIFRKPNYPLMKLIDRKDLDADPVVRFQHRHYVPLTVGLGLVAPTLIGWTYGDALGGFIWGGVVARLLIWHFTFFINSLAHYLGEQAYSLDVTAKGNFLLALFTGGEANHNFHHAFPKDYRNGPRTLDWDPSKWIIYTLHHLTPLVPKVYQTADYEILKARAHVLDQRSNEALDHDGLDEAFANSDTVFARWSQWATQQGTQRLNESETDMMAQASATSSENEEAVHSTSSETTSTTLSSSSSDNLFETLYKPKKFERSSSTPRQRLTRGRDVKLPVWTTKSLLNKLSTMSTVTGTNRSNRTPIVLVLDGYAVDVTDYSKEHPGGFALLKSYAVKPQITVDVESNLNPPLWTKATEAFNGGLNIHGWSAHEKMKQLRIARIVD